MERLRIRKELPAEGLAAEVGVTIKTGKWMPAKVVRWIGEKRYGFIDAKGVDVFARSTCVKGTTKGIIGATVFIKVIEYVAREKGKYKALEMKREDDYMEDVAQGNCRRRRQRRWRRWSRKEGSMFAQHAM